jgi:hypothetical protein
MLTREVHQVRPLLRAQHVLLALIGCVAVLLLSQQCAQAPSRLDASVSRDRLPDHRELLGDRERGRRPGIPPARLGLGRREEHFENRQRRRLVHDYWFVRSRQTFGYRKAFTGVTELQMQYGGM